MQSDWWTYFLSGGLVSALVGVFTLNAKIRKAAAEAKAANLDNAEAATRILMVNIVEPLKSALYDTRKELRETKVEMQQLREAINAANSCRYGRDCPVLERMRHQSSACAGLA